MINTESKIEKWDLFFLDMCDFVSAMSKDPSTKTGAVIVRPDRTVASTGYNGFPKNMPDKPEYYANREEKYSRIVHCEMNALLHAGESVQGYTLYTTGCSCDRCFVHQLQAGIKRFVYWEDTPDMRSRWLEAFKKVQKYAEETGVEMVEYPLTLRRDRSAYSR